MKEKKELERKLQGLEWLYKKVDAVFRKLSRDYGQSKESFPPTRYTQLKDMIKRAIDEKKIQSVQRPQDDEVNEAARQALDAGIEVN